LAIFQSAIVHELVRHVETEEVSRVKELHHHGKYFLIRICILSDVDFTLVHHIQHHTQPLTASEELPQEHRDFVRLSQNETLTFFLIAIPDSSRDSHHRETRQQA
jgi:hypothetical protein